MSILNTFEYFEYFWLFWILLSILNTFEYFEYFYIFYYISSDPSALVKSLFLNLEFLEIWTFGSNQNIDFFSWILNQSFFGFFLGDLATFLCLLGLLIALWTRKHISLSLSLSLSLMLCCCSKCIFYTQIDYEIDVKAEQQNSEFKRKTFFSLSLRSMLFFQSRFGN